MKSKNLQNRERRKLNCLYGKVCLAGVLKAFFSYFVEEF